MSLASLELTACHPLCQQMPGAVQERGWISFPFEDMQRGFGGRRAGAELIVERDALRVQVFLEVVVLGSGRVRGDSRQQFLVRGDQEEGASVLPLHVLPHGSGKKGRAGCAGQGGPEGVVSEQGYGADG